MYFKSVFTLVSILFLLALTGETIMAQSDSVIVPGIRVKVTAPSVSPKPITGKIKELDSSMVLTTGDTTFILVPRDAITKLEISKGTRRSYILVGALGGTIVGLATASIGASSCEGSGGLLAGIECLAWLAAIPAGLVVGTVTGILVSGERWETVDLNRLQGRIGPIGRDLVGVQLSFSF